MNFNKNTEKNLETIIAISLRSKIKNISIEKINQQDEMYEVHVCRKLSIDELKSLNSAFNINQKNKKLSYIININSLLKQGIIKIKFSNKQKKEFSQNTIENILFYEIKVTNRLNNYINLLLSTLHNNEERVAYTFYYNANDHLGFANGNMESKHCIKIHKDVIDYYNSSDIYNKVLVFNGGLTDATCACLRRNYNSKYNGNWKICKLYTPFDTLIYN